MVKKKEDLLRKGKNLIGEKRLREAAAVFGKILKKDPGNCEAIFETGKIHYLNHQEKKSLGFLQKSFKINRRHPHTALLLAKIYRSRGDFGRAEDFYRLVSAFPGILDEKIYSEWSESALESGRWSRAPEILKQAVKLFPGNGSFAVSLAETLMRSGNLSKAEAVLKKAGKFLKDPSRLIQLKNEISHLKDLRKKRISVKAKPLELGITLTTRCNLRCIMCDFPSHEWDIPAGTVSEIKEFMPALRYIYWQGGEVFLSPYFSSLYDETQNYPELVQTFNTNGLLIDDKWAGKLMRNRNELIVSVDGATKEVYEKIRAGGKFKNLLKALETLAKHKNGDFRGSLKMAVVVMRSNYDQLERLIDLARTYRFDEMIFLRINGDYPEENIFSPPDNEALRYLAGMKQKLSTRAKKYGIGLNAEFFENLESPSSQTAEQLPGSRMRETRAPAFCTAPWKRLFIFRGGSVLPHCHCRRPVGDAGRESLESIWNGSAMKEFRRSILRKNIEDICSGGCII